MWGWGYVGLGVGLGVQLTSTNAHPEGDFNWASLVTSDIDSLLRGVSARRGLTRLATFQGVHSLELQGSQ